MPGHYEDKDISFGSPYEQATYAPSPAPITPRPVAPAPMAPAPVAPRPMAPAQAMPSMSGEAVREAARFGESMQNVNVAPVGQSLERSQTASPAPMPAPAPTPVITSELPVWLEVTTCNLF